MRFKRNFRIDWRHKMLSMKVKEKLLIEGINEDAIRALDEKGKCLFDLNSTRDLCFEFIDLGVNFSCQQSVLNDGLYLIKTINKDMSKLK